MIATGQVRGSTSRRILVVDDEQAILAAMTRLLRSQGYQVTTALGGRLALQSVREKKADLVVADVMMPDMDGIELCASIRKEHASQILPVICVSGLSDRESRVRAKEAGADDYLVKPVDTLELLVRIENLFRAQACHEVVAQQEQLLAAKLESATKQILRLERLSTRSSLAAGVGHELTSLATTLRESLASLRVAVKTGEPLDCGALRQVDRVAQHIEQHAMQLLHLGQPGTTEPESIALDEVVAEALALVRASGRARNVALELYCPGRAPQVLAVRADIEQILIHLVLNAAEATSAVDGRDRHISVRVDPVDLLGRARVHVVDNGCGIAAAHLDRIFDPYFSTKAKGDGAGLGLTLVRHLVEGHGGRVVVVSRPLQGTTVTVDFPTTESAESEGQRAVDPIRMVR